jgi:aarF domain-containing kinase
VLGAIDYKLTFAKTYPSEEASQEATSQCHERSARRVLKALLANGGISLWSHSNINMHNFSRL